MSKIQNLSTKSFHSEQKQVLQNKKSYPFFTKVAIISFSFSVLEIGSASVVLSAVTSPQVVCISLLVIAIFGTFGQIYCIQNVAVGEKHKENKQISASNLEDLEEGINKIQKTLQKKLKQIDLDRRLECTDFIKRSNF